MIYTPCVSRVTFSCDRKGARRRGGGSAIARGQQPLIYLKYTPEMMSFNHTLETIGVYPYRLKSVDKGYAFYD